MSAKLRVRENNVEKFYSLSESGTTIGRHEENTISLEDPRLSRFHARIFFKDGEWFAEDLNSSNGSAINYKQFTGTVKITPEDKLRFGTVRAQLVLGSITPETPEAAAPKAPPPVPAAEQSARPADALETLIDFKAVAELDKTTPAPEASAVKLEPVAPAEASAVNLEPVAPAEASAVKLEPVAPVEASAVKLEPVAPAAPAKPVIRKPVIGGLRPGLKLPPKPSGLRPGLKLPPKPAGLRPGLKLPPKPGAAPAPSPISPITEIKKEG